MRQQSPHHVTVPVTIQLERDETAVEPFRLAPSRNPDTTRKQAPAEFLPVYDPPTAPPTVPMEVRQSSNETSKVMTKYNPPAYTEPSNARGSSSRDGKKDTGAT